MSVRALLQALQSGSAIPSGELRARLGLPLSTFNRVVDEAGDALVRLGRTRATRYALPRAVAGLPRRVPVYRVDAQGVPRQVAELVPLRDGSTWVEPARGAGHGHAGLPPVVVDMAPAGYLGRRFADLHPDLALPTRLPDWNDDQRLIAVARRGADCPGDLIVGEESLQAFLDARPEPVTPADFPDLAERSSQGGSGSSAAGEQAKFTACVAGRHVLVKFSPGDGSPGDVRWRELLALEARALRVLTEAGIPAAQAEVVDVGTRRFLVVERFDRVGERGRRGVLTLGPLDDDLFGQRDTWTRAAARLHAAGLLSAEDARRVRFLEAFGIQIGNDDRHFGNLAFYADGLTARPRLTLAPAYDMLPMRYAPALAAGVVPPLDRPQEGVRAELMDVWAEAGEAAERFWASD